MRLDQMVRARLVVLLYAREAGSFRWIAGVNRSSLFCYTPKTAKY